MRVLYIVQYYNRPHEPGGSRVFQFAKAWSDLGHDVEVVTGAVNHKSGSLEPSIRRRAYADAEEHGFKVRRVWSFARYKGSMRKRYLSFLTFSGAAVLFAPPRFRPDIVFASSAPLTTGAAGVVLSKLFRVPLVFEARDLWPKTAEVAGVVRNRRILSAAKKVERWIYENSSKIVVVSQGDKQELEERGYSPNQVHWVPNGVDDWMLSEEPRPVGPGGNPFRITYVGALGRWNNLDFLLDIAARVGPAVEFSFIGDGDERQGLETRILNEGIRNARVLGPVSKQEAFSALQKCDASIVAGREDPHYSQWLPNKFFDYLAAARPLIVLCRGELAALVEENKCGIVGSPVDVDQAAAAIQQLASTRPEERARMGGAAFRLAKQRFQRTDLARRMLDIFQQTVKA